MQEVFYIKHKDGYRQLPLADILYFETSDKYTSIVTINGKHLTLQSLASVEDMLPTNQFCRVHRSYIVSLRHTTFFNATSARVGNFDIPVSKSYKDALPGRVITLSNESVHYTKLSGYDLASLFRNFRLNLFLPFFSDFIGEVISMF